MSDEYLSSQQDLIEKEGRLAKARQEQQMLRNRMADLQRKIIVGGENLLEKAEAQERLLEKSAKELEHRKQKEVNLRKKLQEKEEERLNIEVQYNSLQVSSFPFTVSSQYLGRAFTRKRRPTSGRR